MVSLSLDGSIQAVFCKARSLFRICAHQFQDTWPHVSAPMPRNTRLRISLLQM
jgi:hypothetical protein